MILYKHTYTCNLACTSYLLFQLSFFFSEFHRASYHFESREGVVKGRLGVEGGSEMNGSGHVVTQTDIDTGQGVVAYRLEGVDRDSS